MRDIQWNKHIVFGISLCIVFLLILAGVMIPEKLDAWTVQLHASIIRNFGWAYLLSAFIFLVFSLFMAFSKYGNIKLGSDHEKPRFSYFGWFSMLFAAGMGIGLIFWGVAEPMSHYLNPPSYIEAGSPQAARFAMRYSFFHWGVHPWAIYIVMSLSIAYFSFRRGMPPLISSCFYPLIGDRIYGVAGYCIDILSVFATVFGIVTSLGLGAMQINSGLASVLPFEASFTSTIIIIAVVTVLFLISSMTGLDKGIQMLSKANIMLAITILLFMLFVGPTNMIMNILTSTLADYAASLFEMSLSTNPFRGLQWTQDWTLFYWAWWISWSPFVGMFIARVSKGRTIREFVGGVLFVPVGFTFIWLTFFGNTALNLDMGVAQGALSAAVSENTSTALFKFLEYLPLTGIASVVATILVVTFFVTSSDSGSLVIDIITSGGSTDAPAWQRVFWAIIEGVVAAVLLLAGGLSALQTASITVALPFTVVMLFVCYGMVRGLRMEGMRRLSQEVAPPVQIHGADVPWQRRLKTIMSFPKRDRAIRYLKETAVPALQQVAEEIRASGWTAEIEEEEQNAVLTVYHGEEREFLYGVHLRGYSAPTFAFPEIDMKDRGEANRYYRAEVHLLEGGQHYDVLGYTKEQLIGDILSQYEKHMHFLHIAAGR